MSKPQSFGFFAFFLLLLLAACSGSEKEINVDSLAISQTSAEMEIGETLSLKASVSPSNATYDGITWTSTKPKVASISGSGLVSAISEGNTTITAMAGGKTASCSVTVVKGYVSVSSISLSKESIELIEGDSETLTATVSPNDATDKTVSWTSSNDTVATINDGTVTAVKEGEATITAKAGEKTASCKVVVARKAGLEAIDLGLSVKWASCNLGATKPEEYGDYYAWGEIIPYYSSLSPLVWLSGREGGYSWTSYKWCRGSYNTLTKYCSDPSCGYNGFTDYKTTLELEDDAAFAQLGDKWRIPTISEIEELLNKCSWVWAAINGIKGYKVVGPNGNSIFLPAAGFWFEKFLEDVGISGIYWSSNSFKGAGRYSLEFYPEYKGSRGDFGFYLGHQIRPVYGDSASSIPVQSVSLNKSQLDLAVGQTYTLTATVKPSNATNKSVTWSSSNTSVATVSPSGVVTAKAAGNATITVKTNDGGKTATCTVKVSTSKVSVTGVSLDRTSLSMSIGDTQTLIATVKPSNATDKSVTWTSNNTSVATVSSSGVVTAKAAGNATITVKTNDGGKTAACSVKVTTSKVSVAGVSLDKTSLSMSVGDTQTLIATVKPSNATDKSVTWTSNNTSVATVSSSGVVTAKAAGNATITVKTNDGGYRADCNVTVSDTPYSVSVPEAIDLGLSVKWASFNLGATKPEEFGDYYAWGETEPYYSSQDPLIWKEGKEAGYDWASYTWCILGRSDRLKKYNTNDTYGYKDGKTTLDPEDDAAHVKLGGKWRMPTYEEMYELIHYCVWELHSNTYTITGPSGKSITLPRPDHYNEKYRWSNWYGWGYWTCSLNKDPRCAYLLSYHTWYDTVTTITHYELDILKGSRCYGRTIRPVYGD